MYRIDGVSLDNPWMGWAFMRASRPLAAHSVQRTALRVPGLPGVEPDTDDMLSSLTEGTMTLVVETPRKNFAALTRLMLNAKVVTRDDIPGRSARVESVSTSPEGRGPADAIVTLTAVLRVPGVFWRDPEVTYPAPLGGPDVAVSPWPMDGLVTDAVIRVTGTTGLRIESSWAHLEYLPTIPAGSFLRYESRTGQAFLTSGDSWVGGDPVSGLVNDDGPGEKFAIFPVSTGVADSRAQLRVITTNRTGGARIELRGRPAHLV